MTVPNAVKVISELVRELPEVLTGAETVLDVQMARQGLDAGAQFLLSPGLDLETVQHAVHEQGDDGGCAYSRGDCGVEGRLGFPEDLPLCPGGKG